MEKVKSISSVVLRVLAVVVLLITAGISAFTAYIMFAPDDLPKPFYLNYASDGNEGEAGTEHKEAQQSVEAAPEQHAPNTVQVPMQTMKPGEGIMLDCGAKIINLADPSGRKYIRIALVVEFAPTEPVFYTLEGEEREAYLTAFSSELALKQPVIDDTVITLLSTKSFESLYTAEGKESLRQEIMDRVNGALPEYHAISVYFTEFVVE